MYFGHFLAQVLIVSLDRQLPHNDDEGRVSLPREEGDVSMHNTQIPGVIMIRPKRIRRRGYCGCCSVK